MRQGDYGDYHADEFLLHSGRVMSELNHAYCRAADMVNVPVYGREREPH